MTPHDILHVLGTAQPEGTGMARIVGALAEELDRRRYRLHAWFLGEDGPLIDDLNKAGAITRFVDWAGGKRNPAGALRFWRAFRKHEFALVHQHTGGRSMRSVARLVSDAPIVVHVHGRVQENRPKQVVPIHVRGADAVIAASIAVAQQIAAPTIPVVVHAGVRIPDFARRESGPGMVIGTACRLVPVKGLTHLVAAMAELHAEFPDLRLELAGSGALQSDLEVQVRHLGLADCVNFVGWQRDLGEVFGRWDVFCLPSLEEAFGIAALEAMAAGLPVVATRVGGLPELVDDGRTGYLVAPADVAELAAGIRRLLLDPMGRLAMGAASRERARNHFSAERMARDISAVYDRLAV